MITKNMLGLYKSPHDERDILVESFLKDESLPAAIDRTAEMSPVRNQGNEGACAGFASVVGVKEWQEKRDCKKFVGLSPRYVYEFAKKVSGHKEGTTLSACMHVLLNSGVCEEKFWEYIPNSIPAPKEGYDKNAAKYKTNTYARVRNIDEIKACIADENIGVVLIGVLVYKGMMSDSCRKTGVVPNPSCWEYGQYLGGHALCVVGYNDKSPYFKGDGHVKVKNSWSDAYGDGGYLYLSYKNIKSNMMDAMSCVDIKGSGDVVVARLGRRREWIA